MSKGPTAILELLMEAAARRLGVGCISIVSSVLFGHYVKKTSLLIAALGLIALYRPGPAQVPLGASQVMHWYFDTTASQVSDQAYQLPEVPTQVMVFRNGMRQKDCQHATGACDYSLVGNQVNFTATGQPQPGDTLIFDYIK